MCYYLNKVVINKSYDRQIETDDNFHSTHAKQKIMKCHSSKSNSSPASFNFAITSFSNLSLNAGVKCSFQLPITPFWRS